MRFLVRSAAIAMFVSSGTASAQDPVVLARIEEMNRQAPQPSAERIRAALVESAAAIGAAAGECVPRDLTVAEVSPATGVRAVLQGIVSGQVRNAWLAYATHGGCPAPGPFRYMIVQRQDGSLVAPLVNEGRSIANPSIMRDTSAHAALAVFARARDVDAGCDGRDMKMGPTRVVSQSDDLGPDVYGARYVGSWREVWRFETCGRAFDVPVEFRADGDGGAYTNVSASGVSLVPPD